MTVTLEAKDTTMEVLLKHASSGDEVELMADGRSIATVHPTKFPLRTPEQRERARAAMVRIRDRAKLLDLKFDPGEFKADKEFGRR